MHKKSRCFSIHDALLWGFNHSFSWNDKCKIPSFPVNMHSIYLNRICIVMSKTRVNICLGGNLIKISLWILYNPAGDPQLRFFWCLGFVWNLACWWCAVLRLPISHYEALLIFAMLSFLYTTKQCAIAKVQCSQPCVTKVSIHCNQHKEVFRGGEKGLAIHGLSGWCWNALTATRPQTWARRRKTALSEASPTADGSRLGMIIMMNFPIKISWWNHGCSTAAPPLTSCCRTFWGN